MVRSCCCSHFIVLSKCYNNVPSLPTLGLHELEAINDQEVKDFRSKTFRISEERMQMFQMMTCTEWLKACYSLQLESAPDTAVTDVPNEQSPDLKIIIHFDQSQVRVQILSDVFHLYA